LGQSGQRLVGRGLVALLHGGQLLRAHMRLSVQEGVGQQQQVWMRRLNKVESQVAGHE
jgi:hypothetical protein